MQGELESEATPLSTGVNTYPRPCLCRQDFGPASHVPVSRSGVSAERRSRLPPTNGGALPRRCYAEVHGPNVGSKDVEAPPRISQEGQASRPAPVARSTTGAKPGRFRSCPKCELICPSQGETSTSGAGALVLIPLLMQRRWRKRATTA